MRALVAEGYTVIGEEAQRAIMTAQTSVSMSTEQMRACYLLEMATYDLVLIKI